MAWLTSASKVPTVELELMAYTHQRTTVWKGQEPYRADPDSFEVIEVVLRDKSRRQFFIFPPPCLRFVGASDVALERPKQGTGGFCIVWMDGPGETRSPLWRTYFRPRMTCGNPVTERLHNWRWLSSCKHWYVDHTDFVSDAECGSSITGRFTLIRGRSDSPDLEVMSGIIHAFLFAYKTWIFWEWVPSKSNWIDSISRLGWNDPWHRSNNFTSRRPSSFSGHSLASSSGLHQQGWWICGHTQCIIQYVIQVGRPCGKGIWKKSERADEWG